MKLLKIAVMTYLLLNSINLYAESAKECMKYWSKPAVQVSVLPDVQCSDVWDDSFSLENKKLVKQIGFNLKDKIGFLLVHVAISSIKLKTIIFIGLI